MALHRDIHWIGRQWAVTGFGMQAIDQKLAGKFDIEIARVWDDDLLEVLREQKWFNADDFAKGLAVARKRYPEPPRKPSPPPLPVETLLPAPGVIEPPPKASEPAKPEAAKLELAEPPQPTQQIEPPSVAEKVATPESPDIVPVEAPKPASPVFHMRIPGRARFVRPWRFRL